MLKFYTMTYCSSQHLSHKIANIYFFYLSGVSVLNILNILNKWENWWWEMWMITFYIVTHFLILYSNLSEWLCIFTSRKPRLLLKQPVFHSLPLKKIKDKGNDGLKKSSKFPSVWVRAVRRWLWRHLKLSFLLNWFEVIHLSVKWAST